MKASNPTYSNRAIQWAKTGTFTPKILQVPKNDPTKAMILIMLVFTLFLVLLVNVWIHIDFVHVGYRMAHLKHQEKMLKIENRNLIIQHAALLSDNQLQAIAKKRFHLKPLTPEQIITIDEKD